MRRQSSLKALCLALAISLGGPAFGADAATAPPGNIPWPDSALYSRTSVDDDIRNVLRSLLATANVSAIFRPEVEGKVSLNFKNVAPKAAFERLLVESGLGHHFDPESRTVTVFVESSAERQTRREFLALHHVSHADILAMLRRFGIETDGITYDNGTGTLSIFGTTAYVDEVLTLINMTEDAAAARLERLDEATQRQRTQERARVERQLIESVERAVVRVIPLRFANVSSTTRKFHGETVTVPGIDKTLEAILGPLQRLEAPRAGASDPKAETEQQFAQRMQAISRARISLDPRTNSVIVRGTEREIAEIESVIQQLDQPLKMIEIEVIIATAQVGVAEELGVALRGAAFGSDGANRAGGIDTGTTGGRVGDQTSGGFTSQALDALSLLPLASPAGATVASFLIRGGNNFLQIQLNALEEANKAQVLSAPRLVTLDNNTARITRAQDVFVQVDAGGDNGQALEQINTGLTLEITPAIVPDPRGTGADLIRLNLNAENSAPGSGVFGQIDVRSQEVQTDVLVPNGGTYIVGGLFDDTSLNRKSGVPGLKDVPIVGLLFGTREETNNFSETLFFITPRIIDAPFDQPQDIAARIGTTAYIDQQRRRLGTERQQMAGLEGEQFDVRLLEEDE